MSGETSSTNKCMPIRNSMLYGVENLYRVRILGDFQAREKPPQYRVATGRACWSKISDSRAPAA